MNNLLKVLKESLQSVLPIFAIVLLLSITFAPLESGVLVMFLFGTLLLIVGMGFFTIGSGISMEPLGEGIGSTLAQIKNVKIPLVVCFVLGVLITIAEPDLTVLAEQVPSIPNLVLILAVAIGVGIFLVVSMIRSRRGFKLNALLIAFYALAIVLAFLAPDDFIPTAFDSGGVTTGPITVPFIMALGAGIASMSNAKNARENSFGLIALCSIGPILSVLLLSIVFKPEGSAAHETIVIAQTTMEAFEAFLSGLPKFAEEVIVAILPILGVLVVFQVLTKKFNKHQIIKMCVGFVYTYIGLVLFLTGANVGFMPAGRLIGARIAEGGAKFMLVPIGALMGYFVVSAEPAVHSLKKQVEEITNGSVSQKSIGLALSIGVGASVGIAMLRVLTGIPLLPILIFGYVLSLIITFFVPPIYTGIAFDSGGVASGPMSTTFILPFAIGACEALGGNVLTDAFGIVAMVAMTPLIAIQVMGLISEIKRKKNLADARSEILSLDDDMIYYEEVA
ncbi:MAG: DUF1538 domain-containing protein [Clostridia bacterium]|nr:DUF1538 domain-containing protein [Clostridia bacterium]